MAKNGLQSSPISGPKLHGFQEVRQSDSPIKSGGTDTISHCDRASLANAPKAARKTAQKMAQKRPIQMSCHPEVEYECLLGHVRRLEEGQEVRLVRRRRRHRLQVPLVGMCRPSVCLR